MEVNVCLYVPLCIFIYFLSVWAIKLNMDEEFPGSIITRTDGQTSEIMMAF
jgi:hypothetical protein